MRTHKAGVCNVFSWLRSRLNSCKTVYARDNPPAQRRAAIDGLRHPQLHSCHLRCCRPRRLPHLRRPRSARAAHGHAAPAPASLLARSAALSSLLALVRGGGGRVHRLPYICALRPDRRRAQERSATRWRHPRPARRHGAQRAAQRPAARRAARSRACMPQRARTLD